MAKQTQIQQVTTKDPKKVKAGKGSAEWNDKSMHSCLNVRLSPS